MPTDDTNRWATTRCRATGAGNRSRGTVRGSFNRPIVARTKSLRFARRDAGSRMRCQSASDGRSGGPRSAGSLRREADQRLEECPHRYTRRAVLALRRTIKVAALVDPLSPPLLMVTLLALRSDARSLGQPQRSPSWVFHADGDEFFELSGQYRTECRAVPGPTGDLQVLKWPA